MVIVICLIFDICDLEFLLAVDAGVHPLYQSPFCLPFKLSAELAKTAFLSQSNKNGTFIANNSDERKR